MSWGELAEAAPELAREGRERFDRTHVAFLATLRADGSPRISPIEPYVLAGELVLGLMPSPKLDDLRRDPRCSLHSSVSSLDGGEGEFRIHGRALPVADPTILDAEGTWWSGRPHDRFEVVRIEVGEAVLVEWTPAQDRMTTTAWSRVRGLRRKTRHYP